MTAIPDDSPTAGYVAVELRPWFESVGFTARDRLADGAFNIWGNTLPVEDLSGPDPFLHAAGAWFAFPRFAPDGSDHLRCAGQLVPVPPGGYDWLHVVAAAERHTEDEVFLHFRDGAVDPEWLRVSDFWPETSARFGECVARRFPDLHYPRHVQKGFQPVLWWQRIPVPRLAQLSAVRLPDNPAIHLFAMTCQLRTPREPQ